MSIEYRVVVDKAGLRSCDNFTNLERAQERALKLSVQYGRSKISVQQREVTEWENVTPR